MIAQNSEVYNPPTYLFSLYTYMEKDLCRGLYTSLFCAIIPALFPYFLPFWYPYILLHIQMFFITFSIYCVYVVSLHTESTDSVIHVAEFCWLCSNEFAVT